MPCRYPTNSGGLPSGVSDPPILAARKIKNTTTWTLCSRAELARRSGRIRIMVAPVVPTRLAMRVPSARIAALTNGVPRRLPVTEMPPPELREQERPGRDRHEKAEERQRPRPTQRRAVERRGVGGVGCCGCEQRRNNESRARRHGDLHGSERLPPGRPRES